jgi:2-oxoglutarate ferredoxin oxidoreductase subunit gamma
MSSLNIVIAGFGGQGVLFTGKIIAYAGLIGQQEVSWLPSYGPEMRGGTANCSVCLSDAPIGSPLVTEPDVLIAMNGPSFDKFIDTVRPGGKVFVDSSLVDRECARTDIELFKLPATQLSNENGLEGIANMILLGKVLGETNFATLDVVEQAAQKCVPASKSHLLAHNVRAIKMGMGK